MNSEGKFQTETQPSKEKEPLRIAIEDLGMVPEGDGPSRSS